ncbi:MAG TPA: hypothetical protein VJN39_07735 [Gemmatimonadales bacterium]|nr:hypothetical protein [Gemmatimonadales bacterium]
MEHGWRPDDHGDDELERLFATQRESWRGELHPDELWRPASDDASWRGDEHLADWPEAQAGPEYWMYKRAVEGA